MSMAGELFQLPGGELVGCGLLPPAAAETRVTAMAEYPDELLLEDKDIQRLLPEGWEKSQRQRFVASMINQGGLGQCDPCANIGALEQIMGNEGRPFVPLCSNELYTRVNGGSDNGATLISTYNEIQRNGICSRVLSVAGKQVAIPHNVYLRRQLSPEVLKVAAEDAKRFKAWEAYLIPKSYEKFKRVVASALARRHPIVWAWHVTQAGMRLRNGYLVQGRGVGNHANVVISAKFVGGSEIVHPTNRNSWGPVANPLFGPTGGGWGEGGFSQVTMQDFFACIQYHDFYALTSATIDPLDKLLNFNLATYVPDFAMAT